MGWGHELHCTQPNASVTAEEREELVPRCSESEGSNGSEEDEGREDSVGLLFHLGHTGLFPVLGSVDRGHQD